MPKKDNLTNLGQYRVLSLKDAKAWSAYFNKLPLHQQDIYFTPQFYQLYELNGNGIANCFVFIQNENLAIYPYLKNEIIFAGEKYYDIQGAYGYNGVLSTSYDSKFIDDFYQTFDLFCKKQNIIAEFTRFHPLMKNHLFSESHMNVIMDRQTVWLDLTRDYDQIWKDSYSCNNRNMIRKAQKNDIKLTISNKESDYKLFYEIYLATMKEVGAQSFYYFNEKYILNFNALIGQKQKLLIASYQGKNICAMLLMLNGKYAHYNLSGRVKEFAHLAANNLLLDFAIQTAKEYGAHLFHFGGGTSSFKVDPLLRFKSNFSNDRSTFYFGLKTHNHTVYNQIVNQWDEKFPEKAVVLKRFLLRYRM